MEYNTTRDLLVMKEYGRHIQKMVDSLLTIEDQNIKQQQANALVELMGFLNPQLKTIEDYKHKLWDHLFYMSDFQLNVESPYPIPTKEGYKEKPTPMPYPNHKPKFLHLGRNLEELVEKAIQEEDAQKKAELTNLVAYYIKLSYANWHKEQLPDEAILQELKNVTRGALDLEELPKFKYKPTIDTSSEGKATIKVKSAKSKVGNNNKGRNNNNNNNKNVKKAGGNANFKKRFK